MNLFRAAHIQIIDAGRDTVRAHEIAKNVNGIVVYARHSDDNVADVVELSLMPIMVNFAGHYVLPATIPAVHISEEWTAEDQALLGREDLNQMD